MEAIQEAPHIAWIVPYKHLKKEKDTELVESFTACNTAKEFTPYSITKLSTAISTVHSLAVAVG